MTIILVELCLCDLDIDVLKWTYFPLHSKQIQRWVAEGGFSWTFEKFLKVSKILERSGYQGSYNGNMMEDHIWSGGGAIRESNLQYKRKSWKTTHLKNFCGLSCIILE